MKSSTLCLGFKIGLLLIKFSALFPSVDLNFRSGGAGTEVQFFQVFQVLPLFPSLDTIFATTFFIYMEN